MVYICPGGNCTGIAIFFFLTEGHIWNTLVFTFFMSAILVFNLPSAAAILFVWRNFHLALSGWGHFEFFLAEVSQSLNRNSKGRLSNKEAGKNICDRSASNRSSRNSWSLEPCWREWSRIAVTWQVLRWTFSSDTLSRRVRPSARSWLSTLLNKL